MTTNIERLKRIAKIIENVDHRCMIADGPVISTMQEMTQSEMSEIYTLATGATELDTSITAKAIVNELNNLHNSTTTIQQMCRSYTSTQESIVLKHLGEL